MARPLRSQRLSAQVILPEGRSGGEIGIWRDEGAHELTYRRMVFHSRGNRFPYGGNGFHYREREFHYSGSEFRYCGMSRVNRSNDFWKRGMSRGDRAYEFCKTGIEVHYRDSSRHERVHGFREPARAPRR